ncbi:MAG: enoyl-CoA hydratase/isomerase family protein [Acidimicrobiia bacterium]|nr:enoyl-CoA hydratase/isomerase family protein [Acidimicrobiia bacterium]
MAYDGYETLRVERERGIASVTIDHPPINLFDLQLMGEMARLGPELEADDEVRVIVFRSANPDFFIAHADVTMIQQLPTDEPKSTELNFFHQMVDRFRTMPKVSIGVVTGCVRGGGSEFLLGLDMRFAGAERAVFGQPEVVLGILPGGGGTQRLPRLMGRARAAEVILGGDDFPAALAEHYGWVNRALPEADLDAFVDALATRIASFPAEALAHAKASLNNAELPLVEGLVEEAHLFNQLLSTPPAVERMAQFMELGGQTAEVEMRLGDMADRLAEPD